MNLLFTATSYPPSTGGAQSLMHQLACQFAPRHNIRVISQWDTNRTDWLLGTTLHAPPTAREYQQDGIPVQRITLSSRQRRSLIPWVYGYYFLQGPALDRISNALAAEAEPWAAKAELIHNCRIGREGLSYASYKLARAHDIPFVLTPLHHPRWSTWLHRHYQQLYRLADAVIVLTEVERQICLQLGVSEESVFVTGMGPVLADHPDGPRFRRQHQLGQWPVILFLGQKFAYKGVAALLSAAKLVWHRIPETRFVFVGPRTEYSKRLFASISDSRLLEVGTVSLQEKTDALAACDVLCVPSLQESFGGVLTEAWSLGKPVVAGDIPASRAVVDEGLDGYLVPQQPAAIAERLLYLLNRPDLQVSFGQHGRDKVNQHYTWPRLAEKTEAVYHQTLHGARSSAALLGI